MPKIGLHPYVIKPMSLRSNNSSLKDYTWKQYGINDLHDLGYKGEGVKIAVLDTGASKHIDNREQSYFHIEDMRFKARRGRDIDPFDDDGHGDWVEGRLIGLKTGICPDAKLASLKVLTKGFGESGSMIAAINRAIELDVDIINLSIGMPNYEAKLHKTIQSATEKGIIVCSSAGNNGKFDDTDYPARLPEVIAVGSHTKDFKVAAHSDYGTKVELYDAGENVLSTYKNGYAYMDGTSMACPSTVAKLACLKKYFNDSDIPFDLLNIKKHLICQQMIINKIR